MNVGDIMTKQELMNIVNKDAMKNRVKVAGFSRSKLYIIRRLAYFKDDDIIEIVKGIPLPSFLIPNRFSVLTFFFAFVSIIFLNVFYNSDPSNYYLIISMGLPLLSLLIVNHLAS